MNTGSMSLIKQQEALIDSYEKGFLFEEFITKLFNDQRFKLEKWRKAGRIENGVFPFFMAHPDLELIFKGKKKYRFAVECKWRRSFEYGKITWADNFKKIVIYKDFQSRFRIPVFIAIGIGGHPSAPEKLFLTPLDNISNDTEVYESALLPYKRKPTNRFFPASIQLNLF